ncbi:calcium-transporting ATPase 5, plasma membrane-type isoform X5 [Triticum aestivum]|uniref:calcium-transporting ATPase 5, plasma membrane-type isoform X5 n=1 Tax=Triticum aestivum TaxID=4565 RepID=UPI001D01B099|nr:calcium-transporting ATPase 5, plasma membrane-type-like isoform X5 [Triticum aestivum]
MASPPPEVAVPVDEEDRETEGEDICAFDIPGKNAPRDRLRRWRQIALVLNASRRFRYTLDLARDEERENLRRIIRAHAQVIRAVFLFKNAGQKALQESYDGTKFESLSQRFPIDLEKLVMLNRDHEAIMLQEVGGVSGLSDLLKSNLDRGVSSNEDELLQRRDIFGANTYPRKKRKSIWRFVFEACQDLTLVILMVAAAISLSLGMATEGVKDGWYDGGSIFFAVFLVIFVTATSDYRQSLQFQHLNEEKQNIQVEVIRGGKRVGASIFDLVVGDVVPLKIGDQVPADGVLISGHSLAIDESSMTGESKIVHKDQKAPMLMSGCKVADGYGSMLVTGVGTNTEWGTLMANLSEDIGEETPLQVRLNGVATLIGIVGLSVAGVVLVVLWIRYFTGHSNNPDGTTAFVAGTTGAKQGFMGAISIFTVAVTIVVVAVPEGLPLAVTLTLAYSMRKMMRDKALVMHTKRFTKKNLYSSINLCFWFRIQVRRLSSCETMGSATTICSDKTGTLTLNKMTVVEAYLSGTKLNPCDNTGMMFSSVASLLVEGIAQNTAGAVFSPEDGGAAEVAGSPTEKAILSWGLEIGMNFTDVRSKSSVLRVLPFNSVKKRGGVAVQVSDAYVHIHWKGAAELVLASCKSWFSVDGSVHPMSSDKDPCRPGVRDAVQLCSAAGVKVRMVTGDNVETAKAIAFECGILNAKDAASETIIIEGKVFREMSETAREEVADKITVMARSSPNDKLLLVQALKRKGHVVAVTGDGTNDAPALHEADIGLSMGISGTEVAKESSDIIILDDDFTSVVKVVRWGRSVYANIQKFIQFQLTVNVAALVINVVAAVSSGAVPLNAVELLWVNLIMDTLGALALATEPPTDNLMKRHPVGRREPLVTNIMWRNLFIQALYQITVLLVFNFDGKRIFHLHNESRECADKMKNTFVFNAFVFCQIFNEFNARKPEEKNVLRGVTSNRLFMGIVGITTVLQILIIEFLGKFFGTVRLGWKLWLLSVAIGAVSWPLAYVGKSIPVPARPFQDYLKHCCAWRRPRRRDEEQGGKS